jgi:hypothetical protein
MSTWDRGAPRAQSFHPEFGYLCPSAQFRRKVRNTVITMAAGGLITGSVMLALLPQLAPQAPADVAREATALTAMVVPPVGKAADFSPRDEGTPTPAMAAPVGAAPAGARIVATERAASAHAQASCDDLSGAFLAAQCQFGKAGKSRTARAAHEAGARVASVAIGRAADTAPPAGPRDIAAPARPAAEAAATGVVATGVVATGVAATAVAADEAPLEVPPLPLPRPATLDKKPVKIVRKQAPGGVAGTGTPAAPSPGFDLFALFH